MRVLIFLALMMAPAAAQELGNFKQIGTRFGAMQVAAVSGFQQALFFNGQLVPQTQDRFVEIRGGYALDGETFDWVIVSRAHGGNMCPGQILLLQVTGQGLRQTAPFGECLGDVSNVEVSPGQIAVDLVDPAVAISHRRYVFDGNRLTETAVAVEAAPPAGAGADVTRWVGRHAFDVLRDPSEQARFARILTPGDLEELSRRIALGNQVTRGVNWVFGSGCMAHQCNARVGMFGLRISDGAVVAGFASTGAPPRFFGMQADLNDPEVLQAIAQLYARLPG